jgi:hypothetical protein
MEYKMRILTLGAGIVMATAFAGVAHADFVKTVDSEGQCVAQEGSVMDLQGIKHCLVPIIPDDFQTVEYAGEIKGVTECAEKQTRKTQIGDFCLIALEAKPKTTAVLQMQPVEPETASDGVVTEDQARDMTIKVLESTTPKKN